jgi:large subunit ribosomal protein L9
MRVLLRSDVQGVGRRGDIVEVKSGYARNYLLPSGRAMAASDTMETQATWMRKSRDLRDAQSREAAQTQRAVLERGPVTISARAAANGRLFGSVTEADVANAVREATGVSLERHAVHMQEHLKELGRASVTATLFGDVEATITVEVVAK